jgi:predicted nucleic-acid-binding protein
MTTYLLDTNVLLRSSDSNSPLQALADASVTRLLPRGDQLYITSQIIIEFWVVATRPNPIQCQVCTQQLRFRCSLGLAA